jgi:Protein of unknown function (DUF2934)
MAEDRNARIGERAYHIWLEEGQPHGRHDEHWHRAERELIEEENRLRENSAATDARDGAEPSGVSRSPARSQGADKAKADQPTAKPRARSSRPAASDAGISGSVASSGSRGGRRAATVKPAG